MARLFRDRDFFEAVKWSPAHKVVLDHRTGQVFELPTNEERARRHLPVPWRPEMMMREIQGEPVP